MSVSYEEKCATCNKDLSISIEGGLLWSGEFVCDECAESGYV